MTGFVNIQVVKKEAVASAMLQTWLQEGVWRVSDEGLQETLLKSLADKVFLLSITCQKPNYVVGAGAKLSFGKKKAGKSCLFILYIHPDRHVCISIICSISATTSSSCERRSRLDSICNGR